MNMSKNHHGHGNGHHSHGNGNGYGHDCDPVIPCFLSGTKILTNQGEKEVESLKIGDMVLTRDNGFKPILWVSRMLLTGDKANLHAPYKIPRHHFQQNVPHTELFVSPNHKILITWANELLFDREVLSEAKHHGFDRLYENEVVYYHFMFDQHELVVSNGAWTESFQLTGANIDTEQAQELFDIFENDFKGEPFVSARTVLKKHEAALI
jgi:hypothetical protein